MIESSVRRALQGTADEPVLVFEREFAADPAELWAACTEPARLERFFGTFVGEPPRSVGAEFQVDLGGAEDMAVGLITHCEPMTRIAYDWSWQRERVSHVKVSFTAHDGSTTVRVVHRLAEPDHVASYGGGWEQMLAALGAETANEHYDDPAYEQLETAAVDVWRRLMAARSQD